MKDKYKIDTVFKGGGKIWISKSKRVGWLGHVKRLAQYSKPKRILHDKVGEVKWVWKLRKWWLQDTESDLGRTEIRTADPWQEREVNGSFKTPGLQGCCALEEDYENT